MFHVDGSNPYVPVFKQFIVGTPETSQDSNDMFDGNEAPQRDPMTMLKDETSALIRDNMEKSTKTQFYDCMRYCLAAVDSVLKANKNQEKSTLAYIRIKNVFSEPYEQFNKRNPDAKESFDDWLRKLHDTLLSTRAPSRSFDDDGQIIFFWQVQQIRGKDFQYLSRRENYKQANATDEDKAAEKHAQNYDRTSQTQQSKKPQEQAPLQGEEYVYKASLFDRLVRAWRHNHFLDPISRHYLKKLGHVKVDTDGLASSSAAHKTDIRINTSDDVEMLRQWAQKEANLTQGVNPWDRRAFKFLASSDDVALLFRFCLHETLVEMVFRLRNPTTEHQFWWAGIAGLSFTTWDQSQLFLNQWGPVTALFSLNEYTFQVPAAYGTKVITVSVDKMTEDRFLFMHSLLNAAKSLLRGSKGQNAHHLACLSAHNILQRVDEHHFVNSKQIQFLKDIKKQFQDIISKTFTTAHPQFLYEPPTEEQDPKINWLIRHNTKTRNAFMEFLERQEKAEQESGFAPSLQQQSLQSHLPMYMRLQGCLHLHCDMLSTKHQMSLGYKVRDASSQAWEAAYEEDRHYYDLDRNERAREYGNDPKDGNREIQDYLQGQQEKVRKTQESFRPTNSNAKGQKTKGRDSRRTTTEDLQASQAAAQFSKDIHNFGERGAQDIGSCRRAEEEIELGDFMKRPDVSSTLTEMQAWLECLRRVFDGKNYTRQLAQVGKPSEHDAKVKMVKRYDISKNLNRNSLPKLTEVEWKQQLPTESKSLQLMIFRIITTLFHTVLLPYCAHCWRYYDGRQMFEHRNACQKLVSMIQKQYRGEFETLLGQQHLGEMTDIATKFEENALFKYREYINKLSGLDAQKDDSGKPISLSQEMRNFLDDDRTVDEIVLNVVQQRFYNRQRGYIKDVVFKTRDMITGGLIQDWGKEQKAVLRGENEVLKQTLTKLNPSQDIFRMFVEESNALSDTLTQANANVVITIADWIELLTKMANDWREWVKSYYEAKAKRLEKLPSPKWVNASAQIMFDEQKFLPKESDWKEYEARKSAELTVKSIVDQVAKNIEESKTGAKTVEKTVEKTEPETKPDDYSQVAFDNSRAKIKEGLKSIDDLVLYWKHAGPAQFHYLLRLRQLSSERDFDEYERDFDEYFDEDDFNEFFTLMRFFKLTDDHLRDNNVSTSSLSSVFRALQIEVECEWKNILMNDGNDAKFLTIPTTEGKNISKCRLMCSSFDDITQTNEEWQPLDPSKEDWTTLKQYPLFCNYEQLKTLYPEVDGTGDKLFWEGDYKASNQHDTQEKQEDQPDTQEKQKESKLESDRMAEEKSKDQQDAGVQKEEQEEEPMPAKNPKKQDQSVHTSAHTLERLLKVRKDKLDQAKAEQESNFLKLLSKQLARYKQIIDLTTEEVYLRRDKYGEVSQQLFDEMVTYQKRVEFMQDCQQSLMEQNNTLIAQRDKTQYDDLQKKFRESKLSYLEEAIQNMVDVKHVKALRQMKLRFEKMIREFRYSYAERRESQQEEKMLDRLELIEQRLASDDNEKFVLDAVYNINKINAFEDLLFDYGHYGKPYRNDISYKNMNMRAIQTLELEIECYVLSFMKGDLFNLIVTVGTYFISNTAKKPSISSIRSKCLSASSIPDSKNIIQEFVREWSSLQTSLPKDQPIADFMNLCFQYGMTISFDEFKSCWFGKDNLDYVRYVGTIQRTMENSKSYFEATVSRLNKILTDIGKQHKIAETWIEQLDSLRVPSNDARLKEMQNLSNLYEEVKRTYTEGLYKLLDMQAINYKASQDWSKWNRGKTLSQWVQLHDRQVLSTTGEVKWKENDRDQVSELIIPEALERDWDYYKAPRLVSNMIEIGTQKQYVRSAYELPEVFVSTQIAQEIVRVSRFYQLELQQLYQLMFEIDKGAEQRIEDWVQRYDAWDTREYHANKKKEAEQEKDEAEAKKQREIQERRQARKEEAARRKPPKQGEAKQPSAAERTRMLGQMSDYEEENGKKQFNPKPVQPLDYEKAVKADAEKKQKKKEKAAWQENEMQAQADKDAAENKTKQTEGKTEEEKKKKKNGKQSSKAQNARQKALKARDKLKASTPSSSTASIYEPNFSLTRTLSTC